MGASESVPIVFVQAFQGNDTYTNNLCNCVDDCWVLGVIFVMYAVGTTVYHYIFFFHCLYVLFILAIQCNRDLFLKSIVFSLLKADGRHWTKTSFPAQKELILIYCFLYKLGIQHNKIVALCDLCISYRLNRLLSSFESSPCYVCERQFVGAALFLLLWKVWILRTLRPLEFPRRHGSFDF